VNRGEFDRYADEVKYQSNQDGIQTLSNILFLYDQSTGFLNVKSFQTPNIENTELSKVHDMRQGPAPFQRTIAQRRGRPRMGMFI
jgi:hypothetical protein